MLSLKSAAALVLPFVFFMAGAVEAGPVATGRVEGTVRDALGRALPRVEVTLKTSGQEVVGKKRSDAKGRFMFTGVRPGVYAVFGAKKGFEKSTAIAVVKPGATAAAPLTLTSKKALELSVVAQRLVQARNELSPSTGGSEYHISQSDINTLPQGENTPLNDVLLQAPGVANDSFGQLHIRGDHGNIQYRIDGVTLPEGITAGFGQALDTRFANSINLLTGSLPAEYGYQTAGVVDINTKSQIENGGSLDIYGGSYGTVQPSIEYGGSDGKLNYFVSGSYLGDDLGVENPTSSQSAIHDHTDQANGFAYFSYLLNDTTKLSFMSGTYDGWFQIPNNPGQTPNPNYLAALGIPGFNSAALNENQYETNRYGVISLQSAIGSDVNYQLSYFSRYTSTHFVPDPIGDLVFNGVASDVFQSSFTNGLQGDASYRLNDKHTLRAGIYFSDENDVSDNSSSLFPVNSLGVPTGSPYTIVDDTSKNGNTLCGVYLQDEWKPIEKLTINYGARFDQMNAFVSANQLSPRLGAVYKLTPETTLHAGYSRYFTPPTNELIAPDTLQLYQGTSNQAQVQENSPVLPERSNYYDAGVIQKITPEFNVGLDGYYETSKDLIDEGQFGQAMIFGPFNYAQGQIKGVELTGNYHSGKFGAYANLAVTQSLAKDVVSGQFNFTPDELAYIADNWIHTDHDQLITASLGVSYTWCGTKFTADGIYGSGLRSGFANTGSVPANIQVNLGAMRKFQSACFGPMQARVAILNVFDSNNEIRSGSGIGVFAPQYGPRIGLYAGLTRFF
ncbi:MAG: TonB-dependent receptor [Syntrophobacteraceae bacterium]|nr:TonB-dependent receptor [Syntrophobacteraceae bacterium]